MRTDKIPYLWAKPYAMKLFSLLLFFCVTTGTKVFSQENTTITVRALAGDAKFIGTSMGGAHITIKNADTGELLAKGLTQGGTGNTEALVLLPKKRYETLAGEDDAKFVAKLSLEDPVFVTISATGPYGHEQARATTSTQLWLIPGKDILGDGIVLKVPGFVVDVLKPIKRTNKEIQIKAKITMMCGCPTKPGSTWDSSEYEISALVYHNNKQIATLPLKFSGETSIFEGSYRADQTGKYTVKVYAFHAKTGNSGLDEANFLVE